MSMNDLFILVLDIVVTSNISVTITFLAVFVAIALTFKD